MRTVLMKFIVRGLASGCRDNRASKQREKKIRRVSHLGTES